MKKSWFTIALLVIMFIVVYLGFVALAVQGREGYGWKPPFGVYANINPTDDRDYGIYLMSSFTSPETIRQIAKKHKVGLILYQETHPWPQTHYIDIALTQFSNVVSFVTIFEENSGALIPELNATYDYIKDKYPGTKVYQWPHTNQLDFNRLGELKADGFIINPRWHWSEKTERPGGGVGGFESTYLYPALATGKPIINLLYLGLEADSPDLHPNYIWQYAIGQYQASAKHHVPVAVYEPFVPGFEALVKERIKILEDSLKKSDKQMD